MAKYTQVLPEYSPGIRKPRHVHTMQGNFVKPGVEAELGYCSQSSFNLPSAFG